MVYGYEYEYGVPHSEMIGEGLAIGVGGVLTAIVLIFVLVALAFSVVSYVLSSVGMYRIAKRRGIHLPWLAWVPVGNSWLLGSISDHYQYFAKQKTTKRRKILLILQLIMAAISMVYTTLTVMMVISADATVATGLVALMILFYLLLMGVAIAAMVFCYIAYYDLFQSCKPGYAVLFLVLGVLFNVTLPFFVFACSSSDQGMPAKRTPKPPVENAYEPEQPAEEIPVVEAELVDDNIEE